MCADIGAPAHPQRAVDRGADTYLAGMFVIPSDYDGEVAKLSLAALKDTDYRDHVFAYVGEEDTPRPLTFQLDLLREVGFTQVDVLHKNVCFAAFGGVKAGI